ncbi:hypothetical protein R9X47_20760 [Wukongibacter baidiensis]
MRNLLLDYLLEEEYNNLVKVAVETCEYKQYRDATEHLHIVARKRA